MMIIALVQKDLLALIKIPSYLHHLDLDPKAHCLIDVEAFSSFDVSVKK